MKMGKSSKRFSRITYSSIYEQAYAAADKAKWLTNALHKCRNSDIYDKKQYLKHLQTMYSTQRIFENTRENSRLSGIFDKQFANEKKCINIFSILYLKRIQRQGLKRIYRPNGPMFKKSVDELDCVT